MVSQSTAYQDLGPESAIDNNYMTVAHTKCGNGENVWYKIEFGGKHHVNKVEMYDHFTDHYKRRMDGTRVIVTNESKEEICGILSVTADDNRKKYSISCSDKKGDGVMLRGKPGKHNACIHITRIQVFEAVYRGENIGKSSPDIFWGWD